MSRLLIVPNTLSDAINDAIDKALAGRPCDEESRAYIYHSVLTYYDDHGTIPDFNLKEKSNADSDSSDPSSTT